MFVCFSALKVMMMNLLKFDHTPNKELFLILATKIYRCRSQTLFVNFICSHIISTNFVGFVDTAESAVAAVQQWRTSHDLETGD